MSEDMQQTCKHLGGAVHTAALGKTAMLMESTTPIMLKKAPNSRQRTKRTGGNVLISLMSHASTVNPKVFKALMRAKSHRVAADAYATTIEQNRGVTFTTEQVQRMARFVQHFVGTDNNPADAMNPDAAGPVDLTVFIHMAHDAQIPDSSKQEAADADDDEDYSDLDLDDEDEEDYSDLDIPTATAEVPVTTPDGLTSLDDAKAYVIANGPAAVLTAFNARIMEAGHVLKGTNNGIRAEAFDQVTRNGKPYSVKPSGDVMSSASGSLIQRSKGAAFNMVGVKARVRSADAYAGNHVLKADDRKERTKQTAGLVVLMAAVVEMHDHDIAKGGDPRQYIDDSWLDHPYIDQDVVASPIGQAKSWRIPSYARGDGSSGKVDLATVDVSDLLGF